MECLLSLPNILQTLSLLITPLNVFYSHFTKEEPEVQHDYAFLHICPLVTLSSGIINLIVCLLCAGFSEPTLRNFLLWLYLGMKDLEPKLGSENI